MLWKSDLEECLGGRVRRFLYQCIIPCCGGMYIAIPIPSSHARVIVASSPGSPEPGDEASVGVDTTGIEYISTPMSARYLPSFDVRQ